MRGRGALAFASKPFGLLSQFFDCLNELPAEFVQSLSGRSVRKQFCPRALNLAFGLINLGQTPGVSFLRRSQRLDCLFIFSVQPGVDFAQALQLRSNRHHSRTQQFGLCLNLSPALR